jgi:hypothetical protein
MIVLYSIGILWGFWALYVFTMAIYRAKLAGRLGKINTALALPFVLLAVFVDWAVNMTLATFIFMDLPQEKLVTARLKRYKALGPDAGWRYRAAVWICDGRLDIFDPSGDHC